MFQVDNYISFHDLSPEGRFLWLSPSILDVLGYTTDELVGRAAYEIICPEDVPLARVVHKENMMNDLVASQLVLRYKAKDGQFVPCISVFSLCYDFIISCSTVINPKAGAYMQLRAHSAAMTRLVRSKKEEFERIKRHHEAFAANSWNLHGLEPEPRVCMLLNRFSRNLVVMYASPACQSIFHIDSEKIVGKPILLFIRADDLASFVEQVDVVKATTAITHMRFWFQSPNWLEEIPCEAMLFGCADGMVAIMRRCKPFVRKQLIGSTQQYEIRNPNNDRNNNSDGITRNKSSSWSSPSPSSSFSYHSTPATSISPSPPPNMAKQPPRSSSSTTKGLSSQRTREEQEDEQARQQPKGADPLGNVPMAKLRKIKILDRGDSRTRPLAEIPEDDPKLVQGPILGGYGIREFHVQTYEEEEEEEEED